MVGVHTDLVGVHTTWKELYRRFGRSAYDAYHLAGLKYTRTLPPTPVPSRGLGWVPFLIIFQFQEERKKESYDIF